MFCPNCGNEITTEQKFCRACGLSLEKIRQSVAEQLPHKMADKQDGALEQRRRRMERLGVAALGSLGLGLGGLLFYIMWADGKAWYGAAILALFVFGLFAMFFFDRANSLKAPASKGERQISDGNTTAKLLNEPPLEPMSSITERTTELLTVEKKREG